MSTITFQIFSAFLVLIGCLCSGCRLPAECRAFNDLPTQQQHTEFRAYPVEKQLDVYLCMMKTQPPSLEFADDVADRGEEAIPFVLTKLKTVKREIEQDNLIYIIEVMSDRRYLRGRKDVVTEVGQLISSMKIHAIRERTSERLKRIEINSGIKDFTYIQ